MSGWKPEHKVEHKKYINGKRKSAHQKELYDEKKEKYEYGRLQMEKYMSEYSTLLKNYLKKTYGLSELCEISASGNPWGYYVCTDGSDVYSIGCNCKCCSSMNGTKCKYIKMKKENKGNGNPVTVRLNNYSEMPGVDEVPTNLNASDFAAWISENVLF